ncbi:MAG TPA: hypothetical protein VN493_13145 [Thermoanaerobaculia bacterium]|nr:hypothetical protein [Thermoanaerobaculia bacterium]
MRTAAKVLLIGALALGLIVMGSGVLLAASVVRTGMVTVKVHEPGPEGSRIYVPVPALLVHAGMSLMPMVMEDDVWEEIRTDLGEWGPVAAEVLRAVEDAPDTVLVEVQNDHETVRIVKDGRSLEIRVEGEDGTVDISVPASLLGRIAREIA